MCLLSSRGHGRCGTETQQKSDDINDTETPYVNTTETPYVNTTGTSYVNTTETPYVNTTETPYGNTSLNLNLNQDATDSSYEYVSMGDAGIEAEDANEKQIIPTVAEYEIPVASADARNLTDETSTGNMVNESQYEDLARNPYSNIDVESPYEPLKVTT
jgi:hypothetical protein